MIKDFDRFNSDKAYLNLLCRALKVSQMYQSHFNNNINCMHVTFRQRISLNPMNKFQ